MHAIGIYEWLLIILTVIILLTISLLWYIRRNDDYWEKRGVPFYPRPSILEIIRLISTMTVAEMLVMNHKKYGRVFGGFQFSKPGLNIAEPELLKDILVKDFQVFHSRRDVSFKDDLLENMVSILKGEDWKRVRTVITPAFTAKQMRKIGDIINSCSMSVLETFNKRFQKGEPVDCKEVFGTFTIDVIALSAFATKIDSLNDPNNIFVQMTKRLFRELPIYKVILLSLIPQRLLFYLRLESLKPLDFFKKVILQVVKERRTKNEKYDDLLQTLMDAADKEKSDQNIDVADEEDHYGSISSTDTAVKYKCLTEDELVAQCVLFFFVGYETTASTLAYMAYALALNPEWQDRLTVEVDEAFSKHGKMSYDVVRDMKIMDSVVSETLRMYPPVVISERTASEDYELGNTGIVVEKGMLVAFPIYAMHYDPLFFTDPQTFNPERFMDQTHPQYSYLPFGAGPRNCLGMRFALLEIKLCMANILHQYSFQVGPTTKIPLEFKKITAFLSVNDLPLMIEKR